jgi:hypothetical protein
VHSWLGQLIQHGAFFYALAQIPLHEILLLEEIPG